MYALKIKLGKVTRRVSLNADETSFDKLKETLKRLFSSELTTDAFVVKYKDDENDLITVRFGFINFDRACKFENSLCYQNLLLVTRGISI